MSLQAKVDRLLGSPLSMGDLIENWGKVGSIIDPAFLHKLVGGQKGYGDDARQVTFNPSIGRDSDVSTIMNPSGRLIKQYIDDKNVTAIVHSAVIDGETIWLGGNSRQRDGAWGSKWDTNALAVIFGSSGSYNTNHPVWKIDRGKYSTTKLVTKLSDAINARGGSYTIYAIYADTERAAAKAKRYADQKGRVPTPGEDGYEKYIKSLKSDLRARLTTYIAQKTAATGINWTTPEEMQAGLRTTLPNKFVFNNKLYELDDVRINGVGSGVRSWSNNTIRYKASKDLAPGREYDYTAQTIEVIVNFDNVNMKLTVDRVEVSKW